MTVHILFDPKRQPAPATRSRDAALQAALDELRDMSDKLYWCAVELALSDALRERAPSDPDAAPPGIEPAELRDCGDPAVRELVELMGYVDSTLRKL